jgi:Tol biopolymer transport system component
VKTGKRDVFVAAFDSEAKTLVGSAMPMIPRSFGNGNVPLWSPDGTHLAYRVETDPVRGSRRSIVIQSLETGAIRELGRGGRPVSWTPDERGIFVFGASNLNDPEVRLALYRIDIQTGDEEIVYTLGHETYLHDFSLSPDARTFFVAGAGPPWEDPGTRASNQGQTRIHRIVRVNLETEAFTELFRTSPGGAGMIRALRLSPDGETLAFGYCPGGGPDRLVLLSARGEELREIVDGTFHEVAWMPSGDGLLVYGLLEEEAERNEVFYVDLEGGGVHPLGIFGENLNLRIDVHPDGKRIAFSSTSGTTGTELWVMENFLPAEGGPEGARASGGGG